jgi:hypothetical protein
MTITGLFYFTPICGVILKVDFVQHDIPHLAGVGRIFGGDQAHPFHWADSPPDSANESFGFAGAPEVPLKAIEAFDGKPSSNALLLLESAGPD